jgi:hypothetical protein
MYVQQQLPVQKHEQQLPHLLQLLEQQQWWRHCRLLLLLLQQL